MPLANQNLVITPNVGSSTDYPKMVFTASTTVTDTTITVRAYPTNNGTLSFEGSVGQLFSIANTMTGVIFAVNDISGLPSIQVADTGLVTLAGPGNGSVLIASNTSATSTNSGALQVVGGVGIGGSLYVGGLIYGTVAGSTIATTATNLASGTSGQVPYQTAAGATSFFGPGTAGQILLSGGVGAPTYTNTASVYVGAASSSANLFGGTPGQIHYQSAPGVTSFLSTGTTGQLLVSAAGAPVYTNTGSIYVGASTISVNLFGGIAGQLHYQSAPNVTSFLSTGTTGQLLVSAAGAPVFTNTGSIYVGAASSSVNIFGGTAGQVLYQTAAGVTGFYGPGTAGQLLVSAGASAPVYTNTGSIYVGAASSAVNLFGGSAGQFAYQTAAGATAFISTGSMYVNRATIADSVNSVVTTATNIAGGTAGQVPYQTAAGATSFYGPGTAGQILLSAGTSAPVYTNTGSIYVGAASSSVNIFGGTAGQLHYQSAAGVTAFAGPGTAGQLLVSAGAAAPTYTNTTSIYVGAASNALNIFGGTAGQVLYQTGAGATGFYGPGTAGQLLVSAGAAAPVYTNTGSIYVQDSNVSSNIRAGLAGQLPYQSAPNTTAFVSSGTSGQFLQATTNGAPAWTNTGSMYVNRATIADSANSVNGVVTTATNIAGGTAGQVLYQTAAGATSFYGPGTAGQLLVSAGAAAPVYTNTASVFVGAASSSVNLFGGSAGQFAYQTSAGATAFISTGSMYVNRATVADSASGSSAQVNTTAQPASANYFLTFVDTNNAAAAAETVFTTSSFYVNPATGATNLQSLSVNSLSADTGTKTSNSLYVAGGAWIDKTLVIAGDTTFRGNVVFQGTNTFVYSSSTVYTDNLISLHAPSGSTPGNHTWTVDDGKDIGLMFHYYKGSDKDAFLGFANDTSYLEWYDNGVESGGIFTGTTYGTFKTGAIKLVGGTANTGNTSSGDLTVLGGVGIGQNLYVAGNVTVAGLVNATINGTVTTATNVAGGTAGQLHYQSAPGITAFAGPGTAGQLLVSAGTSAPTYTNTASIYVQDSNVSTNVRAGLAGQLHYQSAPNTTAFVNSGTTGQFLQATTNGAPAWTNTGSMYVNRAVTADSLTGSASSVANALTVNSGGSGSASGTTYNGSAAVTISYNSIGSPLASQLTNGAATGSSSNSIYSLDSRNTNYTPGDRSAGLFVDFKANTTDSLADGGTYHGVLTFRPYGVSNTDFSGGNAQQLATTDNNNLWRRMSTNSSTWGTWYKIIDTGNTGTAYVNRAVIADSVSGGSAQVVTIQQTGNAAYYPTFVDSNNATALSESVYTTSSFAINPSTGNIGINTTSPIAKLHVEGDVRITGITTVTNTTAASSTSTGALQVAGGVGIGKDLYVGGSVYTAGAKLLPTAIQEFTATGGQTTFTVTGGYTVGTIQVFANGVQLANADFTASNGTTVVVTTPRVSGDIIRTVAGLTSSSINNINALAIAYSVAFGA